MSKNLVDFFTPEHAERYDERNRKLSPISDNLHFLTGLVLQDLPVRTRVLSVGAGTGADILPLAKAFPEWSFVAAEPSLSMLNVCRARLAAAGLQDRCEFVHGYASDVPARGEFDAVLAMLVGHFVKREERPGFFTNLADHLRPGGYLVHAEISYDLDAAEFPSMLRNWESVQSLMGATPESLAALPRLLRETLTVVPAAETEATMRKAGIALPVRFFQAFMISGWYGVKG